MSKPILCIDMDGVVHKYSHGWRDGELYDDATEGFWPWAIEAAKHFRLVIYSSRSRSRQEISDMRGWLWRQYAKAYPEASIASDMPDFEFADTKPAAFLTIDDRALTFKGDWSAFPPEQLLAFKPWNMP